MDARCLIKELYIAVSFNYLLTLADQPWNNSISYAIFRFLTRGAARLFLMFARACCYR